MADGNIAKLLAISMQMADGNAHFQMHSYIHYPICVYVYTNRIINIIMHLYKYHFCIPTIHKVRAGIFQDVAVTKSNY